MGPIIVVTVFIIIFILVIRFITKNGTSQSKSNVREISSGKLSEFKRGDVADNLLNEEMLNRSSGINRISGNNVKGIYDRKTKEAIAKYEFPSHKRILEESINLIQTTKSIETLLGRYDLALEHYFWIREQISNGVPIYFESKGNFPDELKEHANFHINRIAENIFNVHKTKITRLKTDKAKENQKEKSVILLSECLNSLKQTNNTDEWMIKINSLQNKIYHPD